MGVLAHELRRARPNHRRDHATLVRAGARAAHPPAARTAPHRAGNLANARESPRPGSEPKPSLGCRRDRLKRTRPRSLLLRSSLRSRPRPRLAHADETNHHPGRRNERRRRVGHLFDPPAVRTRVGTHRRHPRLRDARRRQPRRKPGCRDLRTRLRATARRLDTIVPKTHDEDPLRLTIGVSPRGADDVCCLASTANSESGSGYGATRQPRQRDVTEEQEPHARRLDRFSLGLTRRSSRDCVRWRRCPERPSAPGLPHDRDGTIVS